LKFNKLIIFYFTTPVQFSQIQKMSFNKPSKKPTLTRLFISSTKKLNIPWLCESLNAFLKDEDSRRQIIGHIRRIHVTNIFDQNVLIAEVRCGSDNLDELLENIQRSGSWFIFLSKDIEVEVWEVPAWLGNYAKSYEEERDANRAKLMRKWSRTDPIDPERHWVRLSKKEEADYQKHLWLMKLTSAISYRAEPSYPEHFTKETIQFLKNLSANSVPTPEVFEKIKEEQVSYHVSVAHYPWTLSKQEVSIYRDALQNKIVQAANFLE